MAQPGLAIPHRSLPEWREARHSPALAVALSEARGAFKADHAEAEAKDANLLVYVEITSGASMRMTL